MVCTEETYLKYNCVPSFPLGSSNNFPYGLKLANGVFISHDRTFNQRQEARLYREEKEREEEAGAGIAAEAEVVTGAAASRGRPQGRPRGSGAGSIRGRGSRTSNRPAQNSQWRKRQNSRSEE